MPDLFTYKSIEVTNPNNKDIELLKENGELLEKYHKQISDLIARAISENIDVSNDIIKILNDFSYDRDSLWNVTSLSKALTSFDERKYEEEEKKRENEFDRSLSLTYKESKKGDEWFAEHQKKYHKDFLKKIKKNPFYGGASPVAHCYWRWMACSLGTSCDIVCEECEEKYKEVKKELEELDKNYNEMSKKLSGVEYDNFVKETNKKRKELKKKEDLLYKQSRLELRGIDE